MNARSLLLLPLLTLPATACGPGCTDLACNDEDGYAVFDLDARELPWQDEQDAEYTFTLSWDAGAASCTTLASGDETCDSELILLSHTIVGTEDEAWYTVDAVLLKGFHGSTVLTIERDGDLVLEQTFLVEVVVDHPNGEECMTECTGWVGEVDVW